MHKKIKMYIKYTVQSLRAVAKQSKSNFHKKVIGVASLRSQRRQDIFSTFMKDAKFPDYRDRLLDTQRVHLALLW